MAKENFEKKPRTLEECRKSFEELHKKHDEPLGVTTVELFKQKFTGQLQGFAIAEIKKED